jgi:hypothetical protein
VRNNRFRDLRTAWLRATGCLKHRLLKDKTTRSILLKFAQEEYEPGLRQFWATLSPHERLKLHHPVSIWNRNVEYQNALAGIAKYKVQVRAYYEGLDEDDRTYTVVEFMPDTDEDAEDRRRARLLVEPVPEDDDEPDDADEEPKCLTPTFDQMCGRWPVKLWSDFCKHIDAEMSYGGMGSELEKWWASAKNRQPILEALEPDAEKREALTPSGKRFPDLGHLQYKHYTLPLWALLWDRVCQEIAAQKDEMRAWVEGLTEADREHHLDGLSFDQLTSLDPILLWQNFLARDRLHHYEDEDDDPPFRFDEETGVEEESGENGEDETEPTEGEPATPQPQAPVPPAAAPTVPAPAGLTAQALPGAAAEVDHHAAAPGRPIGAPAGLAGADPVVDEDANEPPKAETEAIARLLIELGEYDLGDVNTRAIAAYLKEHAAHLLNHNRDRKDNLGLHLGLLPHINIFLTNIEHWLFADDFYRLWMDHHADKWLEINDDGGREVHHEVEEALSNHFPHEAGRGLQTMLNSLLRDGYEESGGRVLESRL